MQPIYRICVRTWFPKNFQERVVGLIGVSKLASGHGVFFKDCHWFHTFFVRFPIDVVFLDKQSFVVGKKINMQPWRFRVFPKQVFGILELPAGSIVAMGIASGCQINFEFVKNRFDLQKT